MCRSKAITFTVCTKIGGAVPFSNKSITCCEVMLTPKYVRKCWTTSGSLWSTGSVPSCSVPSSDPIGREAAEPTGSVPSCSVPSSDPIGREAAEPSGISPTGWGSTCCCIVSWAGAWWNRSWCWSGAGRSCVRSKFLCWIASGTGWLMSIDGSKASHKPGGYTSVFIGTGIAKGCSCLASTCAVSPPESVRREAADDGSPIFGCVMTWLWCGHRAGFHARTGCAGCRRVHVRTLPARGWRGHMHTPGGGCGTLWASGVAGGGMAALRDVMVRPIAGGGLADGTADAGGGGSTLPSGGSLADGVSGAGGGGGGGPMAGREAADTVAASGPFGGARFGGGGALVQGDTVGTCSSTATTLWASEILSVNPKCFQTSHVTGAGVKAFDARAKSIGLRPESNTQVASSNRGPTRYEGVLRSPPINHAELRLVSSRSQTRPRPWEPLVHLCACEERWCTCITFKGADTPCGACTSQVYVWNVCGFDRSLWVRTSVGTSCKTGCSTMRTRDGFQSRTYSCSATQVPSCARPPERHAAAHAQAPRHRARQTRTDAKPPDPTQSERCRPNLSPAASYAPHGAGCCCPAARSACPHCKKQHAHTHTCWCVCDMLWQAQRQQVAKPRTLRFLDAPRQARPAKANPG